MQSKATSIQITDDHQTIITGDTHGKIAVYNLTGNKYQQIDSFNYEEEPKTLILSSDGKYLAVGSKKWALYQKDSKKNKYIMFK